MTAAVGVMADMAGKDDRNPVAAQRIALGSAQTAPATGATLHTSTPAEIRQISRIRITAGVR